MGRSWGWQMLMGHCTRSLLVLLSTKHQPSVGTLKPEVASTWVGLVPEWDP